MTIPKAKQGGDGKNAGCPIGSYCLKPEEPDHNIDLCVGITYGFKINPNLDTLEGEKYMNVKLVIHFPNRTLMAWMDHSVIFISCPNHSSEMTATKALDRKKLEFSVSLKKGRMDLNLEGWWSWMIEVWRKSSSDPPVQRMPMNRLEFENLSDLTIRCGDKSMKVHKVQLAKTSEVFKSMFT